jgi:hypothetical protein
VPHPLSTSATFGWGAVGAIFALAVVQVLPFALQLVHGAKLTLTLTRGFGFVLVVLIFIGAGGGVAVLLGDATQAKQAVAYGLGWQSTIGGLIQGARVSSQ